MTSNVSGERPERPWLAFLRVGSLMAVLAGAVGSIGLMLHTGSRQKSLILIGLFTAWVLSPFVALVCAHVVSKQWPAVTRAMLYSMMLILPLGSLVRNGDVALGPPTPKTTSYFLLLPHTHTHTYT